MLLPSANYPLRPNCGEITAQIMTVQIQRIHLTLQTKQLTAGAAILIGVLLLVAAVIYFITPAASLPGFLPGHEAGATTPHIKHGILALGLAVCAFIAARFFYGSAPDTAT